MTKTKMHELADLGQSFWLDNMSRAMIEQGKLKSMIDQGLRGQTSNPTIFEKAMASGPEYEAPARALAEQGKSAEDIYWTLAI